MATILIPDNSGISGVGTVYLLGGDTNVGDSVKDHPAPGLVQIKFETGYKNDVWKMSGTEWYVKGDIRLRGKYHQKIPKTESLMAWTQVTGGNQPPPDLTYDEWIVCEPFFNNAEFAELRSTYCSGETPRVQWSPRRHHGGVYFNGEMYILGGRAREFVRFSENRAVGGIQGIFALFVFER
jgi:hypothetical protein